MTTLNEALAVALHAACCCDEPHAPGSIFRDMAAAIVDMCDTDPTENDSGRCVHCGESMPMHNEAAMFQCGWKALVEARRINRDRTQVAP